MSLQEGAPSTGHVHTKVWDGSVSGRMAAALKFLKEHGKNSDHKPAPSTEGTVWWKLPSAFKCSETPATLVRAFCLIPDTWRLSDK